MLMASRFFRTSAHNVEQSCRDDGNNIVKFVMLQEKTDMHGAMRYISDMHDRLADLFLENYKKATFVGRAYRFLGIAFRRRSRQLGSRQRRLEF